MKTAVILLTWSRVKRAALCTRRLLDTSSCDVIIVTEDDMYEFGDPVGDLVGDLVDDSRVYFLPVSPRPRLTAVHICKMRHARGFPDDFKAVIS